MQEGHGALYLGRRFSLGNVDFEITKAVPVYLTPYLGFRFSNLRLRTAKGIRYTVSEGTVLASFRSKARDKFGSFGGLMFTVGDNWGLRLEGRFLDESAITVSGWYKF